MVVGEGFEPSKLSWQIYSLLPLTAREPHPREGAHSCFAHSPCQPLTHSLHSSCSKMSITGLCAYGAGTRSRTRDLLITSQLLYQLSYTGIQTRRESIGRIKGWHKAGLALLSYLLINKLRGLPLSRVISSKDLAAESFALPTHQGSMHQIADSKQSN